MAFGNHRLPPVSNKVVEANASFVPNPKIARLLQAYKDYAALLQGLTPSQWRFITAFFAGGNIFLTGAAGTGKSYIVKSLFDFLHSNGVSVGRTGLTGVASFNIGGQTLHSWAGLGLADEHVEAIIEKVAKNGKAKTRIRAVEVLFIDEISMAKGDLLMKVDAVLKHFRHSPLPFGGVQLCVTGDLLQLPPVFKADEVQQLAFHSEAWTKANIQPVILKEVVRQQEDSVLLKVLNDVRVGDASSLHLLDSRVGAKWADSEIEPVRIFCKNVDVDQFNRERLAKLATQSKTYFARDMGMQHHIDAFNKNCPAPQTLELKVGAQVMLLANLGVDMGYVNGAIGVVKSFGPDGVTVKFKHGTILVEHNEWSIKEQVVGLDNKIIYRVVATRRQIPLKVCYAVTVHKVQGATLDRAIIDMSEAFGTGMTYTALSRLRDMESLSLTGPIPHDTIRVNPECLKFYQENGV